MVLFVFQVEILHIIGEPNRIKILNHKIPNRILNSRTTKNDQGKRCSARQARASIYFSFLNVYPLLVNVLGNF